MLKCFIMVKVSTNMHMMDDLHILNSVSALNEVVTCLL